MPGLALSPADTAIQFALAQVGKPYKWGATGPDSYDCSGLAMAAYRAAGIDITRTTYTQALKGTGVSQAALMPGDLVFPDAGHVQIYLGNGRVVEAPHTGANVRVVNMWGFWKARRVTNIPGSIVGNAQNADVTTGIAPNLFLSGLSAISPLAGLGGIITGAIPGAGAIEAFSNAVKFILDPLRVIMVSGGVFLILLALWRLTKHTGAVKGATKVASKAITSVAKS